MDGSIARRFTTSLVRTGKRLRRAIDKPTRAAVAAAMATAIVMAALPANAIRMALAAPCDPPVTNPILCENSMTGNPVPEWDLTNGPDTSIVGFTDNISYQVGNTVNFKISTPAAAYTLDIYRLGYYGGLGARKVDSVTPAAGPQNQTPCLTDASTGLVDCGNWGVSASWTVSSSSVTGVYFAKIKRTDTAGANHVVFVVRDDASQADIVFQTSDTTWQAYNNYGGNSLYTGAPVGRAYKVSYNRPFNTNISKPESWLFADEEPTIRFLESNGYNVSYISGVDTDRLSPSLLQNHKAFLSVGHDEYWSAQQRANVEFARDHGVNLAFLSGNEVFWKTRWENSIDGSNTTYRILVSYKETQGPDTDPDAAATGTWRDSRFGTDAGKPENSLTGTIFMVNGTDNRALQVPAAMGKLRFWRGTPVATNALANQPTTISGGGCDCIIGYEWDSALDNGASPAGLVKMSSSTYNVNTLLQDQGVTFGAGSATHSITLYRAASGARVFGAGTVNWAAGLDGLHSGPQGTPPQGTAEPAIRQAMVNLFADMNNIQPASIQTGLTAATASSDAAAPTSTVTSPANNAHVAGASDVTISGTASDTGGGIVGGVEVSVDGGATWHPATGDTAWSYTWHITTGPGVVNIKTRAADDSGNVQTPGPGINVTVDPAICPCTIFRATDAPSPNPQADTQSVEIGVRFMPDQNGYVNGIRFYKETGNMGIHTGTLWNGTTGAKLATATFTTGSGSETGWHEVLFAAPITVTAGTTYVASYHAPQGNYSVTRQAFANQGIDNAPMHALKDNSGTGGLGNGVYQYSGATPLTPTWSTSNATNYWVDAVFNTQRVDPVPPTVVSTASTSTGASLPLDTMPSATFSEDVRQDTLSLQLQDPNGANLSGALTYNQNTFTETLTPSGPLALGTVYTATVAGVRDISGNPLASSSTFKLTTPTCPCSLFADTATPAEPDHSDAQSVELGTHFRTHIDGYIRGVRLYKGPANTGTHTGNLWLASNTSNPLASVAFSGETASGWQTALFSTPVYVQPGVDYVVSYHTNTGYSVNTGYFATVDTDSGPLIAPSLLSAGGTTTTTNGVYSYGTGGYPSSPTGSNYWVDVVFHPSNGGAGVQILSQSVTTVDQTTANLAWTTDKLSDTLVAFGPTNAYGSLSLLNTKQTTSHTMSLTGLSPNATYHYQLRSRDSAGNPAASGDLTLITPPIPDTTPPVISDIAKDGQNSSTKMLITWLTNEPADTQLHYGPTSTYGTTVVLDQGSPVTSHSVQLQNLTPSTPYHFQVLSKDGANNVGSSADDTFTTGNVQISGVNAQIASDATGDTAATISWTTDASADTVLDYGTTAAYGTQVKQNEQVTSHTVQLTGLTPGTLYHFRASSTANTQTTSSGDNTFTTRDHVPPVISAIATSHISQTSETITWTTDEPSTSRVDFGTSTPQYGQSASSSQMVTAHSLALPGLTSGTMYHFTVTSTDAAGNFATTADNTFTSLDNTPPQFSTPVTVINVTSTGATVAWGTNELSDTTVKYGLTTTFSNTVNNAALVTAHSINLTNLTPNTKYHYQASSKDQFNNVATTTTDLTFTTLPMTDTTPPVISIIKATPTTNSVTITWTTNEASDSQVLYGLTASYGTTTTLNQALVTSHTVTISSLTPNKLYHFQVKSRDANKNLASSTDQTFSTLPLPRSLELNGTTAYAQAPNAAELNVVGDWTVETWFKDENPKGYYHGPVGIIVKGDVVTDREIPFAIGIAYNQLFLAEKANNQFSYMYYDLVANHVSANSWHHLAVTIKVSTRQATLFLDGVQVLQGTLTSVTTVGNSKPVTIGRNGASTGYGNFLGNLDDVRIWNVVRTASQIGASYRTELTTAQSGLVANWRFNEGTGTTAADTGSSPQTATLYGGAGWSSDVHP